MRVPTSVGSLEQSTRRATLLLVAEAIVWMGVAQDEPRLFVCCYGDRATSETSSPVQCLRMSLSIERPEGEGKDAVGAVLIRVRRSQSRGYA